MNRRQSLRVILLAILTPLTAALTGCFRSITEPIQENRSMRALSKSESNLLIANGSIAAFLESRGLVLYHENTDWSFPGEGDFQDLLYMIDFQGYGLYGYELYVDGGYVAGAINSIYFSPSRQRMRIDHYGQTIWRYKPSRRPNVHMHEAVNSDQNF